MMKIAAAVEENLGLDSPIAFRFARAPYFVIYDTETGSLEFISNPYSMQGRGVGPAVAQMLASKGVKKVIAPSVGPNAQSALSYLGIEIVIVPSGTPLRQALRTAGVNV